MLDTRGRGDKASVLENLGERICPACGRPAVFTATLRRRRMGVPYLCTWVTRHAYVAECADCGSGLELDSAAAQKRWPKDGIPFWEKWSWVFFLIFSAALITAGVLSVGTYTDQTAAYLASPQRRDLYILDLAAIPDGGFEWNSNGAPRDHAYGVMKLMTVDNDELIFATSTTAFTDPSGIIELLDHSPYQLNFDSQNLLAFDKKDILHLRELNIILEVRR